MRHGVTFRNHYIAAAMCSPSRAALLTGQPPQRNLVTDNMGVELQRSLDPNLPSMGSLLKSLGYRTAYFGKFEMDKKLLATKETINYTAALQPYGFDEFGATGDVPNTPYSGYRNDHAIAGEGLRWLRSSATVPNKDKRPFCLFLSFLNPHDIMYGGATHPVTRKRTAPPANTFYERKWAFDLPASLHESLDVPGMPAALAEYQKGWSGALGAIPAESEERCASSTTTISIVCAIPTAPYG